MFAYVKRSTCARCVEHFLNWAKPNQNSGLQCSFSNYVESFITSFGFLITVSFRLDEFYIVIVVGVFHFSTVPPQK